MSFTPKWVVVFQQSHLKFMQRKYIWLIITSLIKQCTWGSTKQNTFKSRPVSYPFPKASIRTNIAGGYPFWKGFLTTYLRGHLSTFLKTVPCSCGSNWMPWQRYWLLRLDKIHSMLEKINSNMLHFFPWNFKTLAFNGLLLKHSQSCSK